MTQEPNPWARLQAVAEQIAIRKIRERDPEMLALLRSKGVEIPEQPEQETA